MTIETNCSNCGTKLIVSSELSGSDVRCPQCDYVFRVESEDQEGGVEAGSENPLQAQEATTQSMPIEERTASTERDQEASSPRETPTNWFLRIPEGRVFGPVSRDVLDDWVSEGRVSSDCGLRTDSDENWSAASDSYPMLVEDGNPFGFVPVRDTSQPLAPHRGKLILLLALCGCIVPFVSLWSAIMGTRDLRLIILGKMDPRGDVMTRAGQAIAMVSSIIWIAAFGIALLVMLIRLAGSM